MNGAAAGGAAAAAAAEAARKRREEEEEMTSYNREELADDWEFKILRSATGAFRNPDKMQRFLDEEAQFGWVLVEKFDNQRLRLKRRRDAKPSKLEGGGDPYRTNVGTSEAQMAMLIVFSILLAGALLGVIVLLANG